MSKTMVRYTTAAGGMRAFSPLIVSAVMLLPGSMVVAQTGPSAVMERVAFEQRLGEPVPLSAPFVDSSGSNVQLSDYFDGKPVILALVYYECPMLCTLELNGLLRAMKALSLTAGEDFTVVTVSFDPGETSELAAAKRESYLRRYGRPSASDGWHFLTGPEESVKRLCDAVGFRAVYDPARDEYAHAAGLVIVTPGGEIARYYFGVDYATRDLRLGLVESSAGKIGSATDHLLLLCYAYDPTTGKYGVVIMNVIRLGAGLTILILGGFIGLFLYRDRQGGRQVTEDRASPHRDRKGTGA